MKQVRCPACRSHKVTRAEPASCLEFLFVAGLLLSMVLTVVFLGLVLSCRWSSALVVALIPVLGTGLVILLVLRRSGRKEPAPSFARDRCGYYWHQDPEETQDEPMDEPIPARHEALAA